MTHEKKPEFNFTCGLNFMDRAFTEKEPIVYFPVYIYGQSNVFEKYINIKSNTFVIKFLRMGENILIDVNVYSNNVIYGKKFIGKGEKYFYGISDKSSSINVDILFEDSQSQRAILNVVRYI